MNRFLKLLLIGMVVILNARSGVTSPIQSAEGAASAEYHFSLAQAYAFDGETDRAIEEYKLALFFDPKAVIIYTRLAAEYVKKGLISAAIETCRDALSRDSRNIEARLLLAGLYSASRDGKAALSEYNHVLKLAPEHEEAAIYKAQLLFEQGKGNQAIQSLKQFIHKNPDSALAWYDLGRIYHQIDRFRDAVIAYRKATAIKPSFSQAALALGFLYEEKRQISKAISIYKVLFDDTQDFAAANRLALLYLKDGKYDTAIPYLEALEEADPEDLGIQVKLGLVFMELRQYDKAVHIFKAILVKNPDADRIHYYLGTLFEETKKIKLAVEQFRSIQSTSQLYGDAILHSVFLLKQSGELDAAKSLLKEAIGKAPRTPGFYLFQANLEEELKDFKSARHILEKASEDFPEDERIHYYLGNIYDRQGEIDKSLREMEKILSLNPKNVDALNYLGYTWTLHGMRLDDAEKVLRRALTLSPKNGYIQDSWGWYLFVRGKNREAIVELEKAAKLKPDEPTILEHLGDAYLKSNLRQKALAEYLQAVQYADSDESKKKIEEKADQLRSEMRMSVKSAIRLPANVAQ